MDIAKGTRFLAQPRQLEIKIKRLEYEIEELRTMLEPNAVRYDLDKVKTSPKDSMSEIFARIDALERELEKTRKQKTEIFLKISNMFAELPESPEKTILYGFYLHRLSMETIAEDLHYHVRWCYRLRIKGIKQLKEIEDD